MSHDPYVYLVCTNAPGASISLHSVHKDFEQAEEVAKDECYLEIRRVKYGEYFGNAELWFPRYQEWER